MVKSEIKTYHPSFMIIKWNQLTRFLKIGSFLHFMALVGIFLFVFGIKKLLITPIDFSSLSFYFWSYIALFGLTIPFFSELDAHGRFQNYKQVKDKLYSLGYDNRLIKPFMHSKCQRIAILVAAKDLGYENQVKKYFYESGYRWYHILPDNSLKNPLILFKKSFWEKILFVKYYKLQNFYW